MNLETGTHPSPQTLLETAVVSLRASVDLRAASGCLASIQINQAAPPPSAGFLLRGSFMSPSASALRIHVGTRRLSAADEPWHFKRTDTQTQRGFLRLRRRLYVPGPSHANTSAGWRRCGGGGGGGGGVRSTTTRFSFDLTQNFFATRSERLKHQTGFRQFNERLLESTC